MEMKKWPFKRVASLRGGTVPKSNRKIKYTTLLEQFQNLTEK
jgi:hypothetical protein